MKKTKAPPSRSHIQSIEELACEMEASSPSIAAADATKAAWMAASFCPATLVSDGNDGNDIMGHWTRRVPGVWRGAGMWWGGGLPEPSQLACGPAVWPAQWVGLADGR